MKISSKQLALIEIIEPGTSTENNNGKLIEWELRVDGPIMHFEAKNE